MKIELIFCFKICLSFWTSCAAYYLTERNTYTFVYNNICIEEWRLSNIRFSKEILFITN